MTAATAGRVLRQLRHDPRTIAMMLLVPSLLLGLLYLLWEDLPTPPGQVAVFDRVGLTMLGIFPFVVMFLVTSIAMLRERTSGTLERLLTTPLSRPSLLLGYGTAFGLAAAVQAVVTVAVATTLYDLSVAGSLALVEGLGRVAGLSFPTATLAIEASETRHRLDELVSGNHQHEEMLRQLEEVVDSSPPPDDLGPLPTGDQLADEFEKFLRDQES